MLFGLFVATAEVKLTNTAGGGSASCGPRNIKVPDNGTNLGSSEDADRYQAVRNDLVVNQRLSATVPSEEFPDSHYLW